ncbi:MAG: hypothetical protein ABIO70_23950 [Pseudomonadota bacterium]
MSRPVTLTLIALVATGCPQARSVALGGVVLDAPHGDGEPAPGIEVTVLDGDLEVYDQATTDEAGAFALRAAAAQDMFLELRGEGKVTTLFAGEAGVFDMSLVDGALYVLGEQRPAELAATFGDCAPSAAGGIAEGEVRAYIPGEEESDLSLVGNAWVVAYDVDNDPVDACYLDADGAPAPEGQALTNATGRFAVFGLQPGPHVLQVSFTAGSGGEDTGAEEGETFSWFYKVNMVEGGLAPFYPAWVEL